MLGKLIKHEWKRIWKIPTLLLLILWGGAFFSALPFASTVFKTGIDSGGIGSEIMITMSILLWCLFFIGSIGVCFGIIIYLAMQFYYSMYSDEGYLTHTLPVTPTQLLLSKGLVMMVWDILNAAGLIISYMIFAGTAAVLMDLELGEIGSWIVESVNVIFHVFNDVVEMAGGSWGEIIALFIINSLVGLILGTAHIIGAITIGQRAVKHKIGIAIAAGCIISAILSLVNGALQIPLMTVKDSQSDIYRTFMNILWIGTLVYAVITMALFLVSRKIIAEKLNLE